jgi:hypothetical protein
MIILIIFTAIFQNEIANFPYDGCSTEEMDVLCLYFNRYNSLAEKMCSSFVKHLLSFSYNRTTPRVLFAEFYDSVNSSNINVSSWHLHSSSGHKSYGLIDNNNGRATMSFSVLGKCKQFIFLVISLCSKNLSFFYIYKRERER